jgi:hypothetical protein
MPQQGSVLSDISQVNDATKKRLFGWVLLTFEFVKPLRCGEPATTNSTNL